MLVTFTPLRSVHYQNGGTTAYHEEIEEEHSAAEFIR